MSEGLPIVDPDEVEDLAEEPRTVLITGAAGNIARKLRAAWRDFYDLVLIDRAADPDEPDLIEADLATWDDEWVALFEDVDAVVHLAADPDEFATWEEVRGPNLDALNNVFLAAALGGVDRLVFASSNHAMGGHRWRGDGPISVDLPPLPDGAYGATKLVGERLGIAVAKAFGMGFVGLRIGWVQRGENRPETMPDAWSRSIWLSNGDCVRLFTRAIEADLDEGEAVVVNGTSRNRGTRWTFDEAAARIGYEPEEKDDPTAEDAEERRGKAE